MSYQTSYKLTDREKDKIWLLHTQGVKRRYIAERFSVSRQTISHFIFKRKNQQKEIDNNS